VIETAWQVITGAPSSGKTTLIKALEILGHAAEHEVARDVIASMLACQCSMEDIHRDIMGLQRKILALKLKREHGKKRQDTIFFDRGTPDSIAYFSFYNLNPEVAIRASSYHRYKRVFFCEPLPFVSDHIRTENAETALHLSELIYDAYCHLGYELIPLPDVSVEERLAIIIKYL